MSRFMYLGNNFTGGQVSPLLAMRSDFTRHKNGVEALENLVVLPQGSITSRTGTQYIEAVKNSANNTFLIPFEVSTDITYMIEAGDQYFRFYRDGAQIESGGSPYEVAHPYSHTELEALRWVQSNDVLYLHHGDYQPRTLSRTSDTSWTLALDEQLDGPYLNELTDGTTITFSGTSGTVTATATSAIFAATDTSGSGGTGESDRLLRVQNQGSGSTITGVTQADPAVVTYSGSDVINNGDTVFITGIVGMTELNGKSFEVENVNTGANTFELKDTDSTSFTAYTSGGKAQPIRDQWVWMKITGFTSTTQVTVEIQGDDTLGSTGPYKNIRLGAWSTTTGYPWMGTFFENRLVRARTDNQTGKLWASAVDGFNDYAPGTNDDNSWNYTLASTKLDAIQWISPQRQLRVGTAGTEYTIDGGGDSNAVTPTNVRVRPETAEGSLFIPALSVKNSTLFAQRSRKKILEFAYTFESDGFNSPDLTLASEDILRPGVKRMAFQKEPHGIVWIAKTDGSLAALTYLRDQDVVAWHDHTIGGTDVSVEDVAVIPGDTETEVWMIVSRTIDGATVKYVEKLGEEFRTKEVKDATFLDSYLTTTSGTPFDTVTGLDHLEGESVTILADGAVHPNVTVSSGSITLNKTYSTVHVGLGYTQRVKTLHLDAGSAAGSSYGSRSRISTLTLRFFETVGCQYRASTGSLQILTFRNIKDVSDSGVPLFTGEKEVKPSQGWGDQNWIEVVQDQPLPMTLLGYVAKLEVSDAP